jgi:hypothetical protein
MYAGLVNQNQYQGGLGLSFFGRIARRLAKIALDIVASLPIVGGAVSGAIQDIEGVKDWIIQTRGAELDYEPTALEEIILEEFTNSNLVPFYSKLAKGISTTLSLTNTTDILTGINAAIIKMCVARTYYTYYDKTGLSEGAVQTRLEIINTIFKPLEDLLNAKLQQLPVSQTQLNYTIATQDMQLWFFPLFLNKKNYDLQYKCNVYQLGAASTDQSGYVVPVKGDYNPGNTLPGELPVQSFPITFEPISTVPAPVSAVTSSSKSFLKENWLWILVAGFVGYKVLK